MSSYLERLKQLSRSQPPRAGRTDDLAASMAQGILPESARQSTDETDKSPASPCVSFVSSSTGDFGKKFPRQTIRHLPIQTKRNAFGSSGRPLTRFGRDAPPRFIPGPWRPKSGWWPMIRQGKS